MTGVRIGSTLAGKEQVHGVVAGAIEVRHR